MVLLYGMMVLYSADTAPVHSYIAEDSSVEGSVGGARAHSQTVIRPPGTPFQAAEPSPSRPVDEANPPSCRELCYLLRFNALQFNKSREISGTASKCWKERGLTREYTGIRMVACHPSI